MNCLRFGVVPLFVVEGEADPAKAECLSHRQVNMEHMASVFHYHLMLDAFHEVAEPFIATRLFGIYRGILVGDL